MEGVPRMTLLAVSPKPQCCLSTEDYGTLVLSGKCLVNTSIIPDVTTLSILSNSPTDTSIWKETPLLHSQKAINHPLVATLRQIPGLEERLQEAASGKVGKDVNPIQDFLIKSSAVIEEFLEVMKHYHKVEGKDDKKDGNRWSIDNTEALIHQVQDLESTFGSRVVQELDDDLLRLTLQYRDQADRLHQLRLQLSPESFPWQCPVCITDLPTLWEPAWTPPTHKKIGNYGNKRHKISIGRSEDYSTSNNKDSKDSLRGLSGLYKDFCRTVDGFSDLFDELDDLDATAWILEPSVLPARRSLCERRTALTESISLTILLDPSHPRSLPSKIRFIGSDVSELRARYQRYTTSPIEATGTLQWSEQISVRENIERCLDITLPGPANATTIKSNYAIECGICYTHALPDEDQDGVSHLPDVACENVPCARSYHQSCLYEWLRSLPTARISFDRIIGTCPYCCEPISGPVESTVGVDNS